MASGEALKSSFTFDGDGYVEDEAESRRQQQERGTQWENALRENKIVKLPNGREMSVAQLDYILKARLVASIFPAHRVEKDERLQVEAT